MKLILLMLSDNSLGPVMFEGWSALTTVRFNPGFFIYFFQSLLEKNFLSRFLEHPMIKLQAKRFELNFLWKLTDLTSDSTLTLGYLNPALNNSALIGLFSFSSIVCLIFNWYCKEKLRLGHSWQFQRVDK